ncbi:MAG: class I mannose-6-phosphate isomerase, partial [Longicatena caecimuris]|uniref:class I mannose-6-phosphate isomerase n=3 Tax=Erysipelotrichaceae TaxID=128827 RepID=UPI00399C2EA3
AYAKVHEHDLGKAEFCLFLDVDDGTKLVRGHRAKSRGEFQKMALEKRWDELLIRKEVKTGDFVYTPAGVVHGVEGKMLMAEVQQSSDVTYRIYDYDNVDVNGKPRELHLEKALDVVTIPHEEPMVKPQITEHGQNEIQQYIDNAFFRITKYGIHEAECIENETYSLCLVLDGKGTLITGEATYGIGAGMSFIMTSNAKQYTIDGNLSLLVSEPGMVKGE